MKNKFIFVSLAMVLSACGVDKDDVTDTFMMEEYEKESVSDIFEGEGKCGDGKCGSCGADPSGR
jgi:uncharacterized low-complexity protein